jgi:hypothetical protein
MKQSMDEFGFADDPAILNWTAAVLAVHAVMFLTLVGLAVGYPGASEWLSAAVQGGEFWQTPRAAGRTEADRPSGRADGGQKQLRCHDNAMRD